MNPYVTKLFQIKKHIVFLTGAGVSTPSGIPDYRSRNGLYHKAKRSKKSAEWYLSHDCLVNHPRKFHRFMTKFMYHPNAKPNVIHRIQAKLTQTSRATIITQNVDNLYRLAGADPRRLIEFHGNIYDCHCMKCHRKISWRDYLKSPVHQADGGLIRPNLVLYGEGIDHKKFQRSMSTMLNADLIIIVGTAMKVEPFADLIKYHQLNVPIIAINRQPLRFSYNTGLKMVQTDALKFFSQLAKLLHINH